MTASDHDLRLKDEAFAIVGAAMEVANTLGHGLLEKPYERALAVELGLRGIPFTLQRPFQVMYKSINVGDYVSDLIVFNQIVVEIKCIQRKTDADRGQVLNYLRLAGLGLGLILNFRHAKLQWDRVVLD